MRSWFCPPDAGSESRSLASTVCGHVQVSFLSAGDEISRWKIFMGGNLQDLCVSRDNDEK